MSLYRRTDSDVYWISFTDPVSKKRVRVTTGTADKIKAQEYHDRLKANCWDVAKLDAMPDYTWEEAALRWLDCTEKKTLREDAAKIKWFNQYFAGSLLKNITATAIRNVLEIKRKESSGATANRYLALIRSILRASEREWGMLDRAPVLKQYDEKKRRIRYLSAQQFQALLAELPEHQKPVVLFALSTGLRQGNVLNLKWEDVDLDRGVMIVHGDEAKGDDDIGVALNATAVDILKKELGKHKTWVFTYKGERIGNANTKAWTNALKRAGIENFRWHDLRHTWASWLAQSGVSMFALQEMGGWKSSAMVRRYAALSPEHTRKYATEIDRVLGHESVTVASEATT